MVKEATTDILMKCHDKDDKVIAAECPLAISPTDNLARNIGLRPGPYIAEPFTAGSYSLISDFNFAVELVDKESTEHKWDVTKIGLPESITDDEKEKLKKSLTPKQFDESKAEFFAWRSNTNWNATGADRSTYPVKAGAFSLNRQIDRASPILFEAFCNKQRLAFVTLLKRTTAYGAAGTTMQPKPMGYLRIDFSDVIILGIDWKDGEVLTEQFRFEARTLVINYMSLNAAGKLTLVEGVTWAPKIGTQVKAQNG